MRDIEHVSVTTTPSANTSRSYRLLALCLLLALAAITAGCGAVSQSSSAASTQRAAHLALFVPAASGEVGVSYNVSPSVSGGSAPYLFSAEGALPPGVTVNSRTGSITGMPTASGSYNFKLLVADPPRRDRGVVPVQILIAAANSNSNKTTRIAVSPASATVNSQGVLQFSASITGTSNTAVTWTASAGAISSSGKFTAPQVTGNTPVTITATSSDGPYSTASVSVTPVAALAITTSSLMGANVGVPYSASLSATGGSSPYQWSLSSGTLPSGIQLQPTGVLAGSTGVSGSYPFTAKVTDSSGNKSTHPLTLSVSSLSTSGYDGPAELPRVYIQSAMANTPAPGTTITVNSGGDFQSALNSASCGDTIALQAGATFSGVFTFPAKSCDENHWIIVRTSASDSALPAEGSRLTPCYAGVASLPGRPAFNCTSTSNVLAKLVMPTASLGPIIFVSGANYYRLIGLEVTRLAGTGIVYSLASVKSGGTASNVILDRVWLHGTAHDETGKGLQLGGFSYASVVDSFFTDLHCVSVSGSCTDAAAVSGGANNPVGPFKIVDNFLESSGENIIFGGALSATTPGDIEIRQNHLFKPLTWMKGQAGYVGGTNGNPFIVKNFFELKNAQRVLFEANIMENTWGGFSQNGDGILLTPKNQASGTSSNLCPNCFVTDVTVRYNTMSHVGGGMEIANGLSDNGGAALDGQRYSIHDLIVDDVDPVKYAGSGRLAEITTALGAPLLQNVSINHITAFPPSGLFTVGGVAGATKMPNFIFANSLVTTGTYPVWSTGGTTNCAYYDKPLTTFNACFSPYSFANNALIATPSGFPASVWPTGNLFPTSAAAVQFVNYNNGNGGDYHLLSSSPYKNAGSDGKDLGADIDAIQSETLGVY
jgi:hypothetical protein